jgi:hypothetical protein
LELLFGGTPASGFVIGGALRGNSVVDPTIESGGQEVRSRDTAVGLSSIALFGVLYPDPQTGFNLEASLGVGRLEITVDGDTQDLPEITGVVLTAGAGYDFWVGDEWSIGPSFLLTYGALTGEDSAITLREKFVSPTLQFSATFH